VRSSLKQSPIQPVSNSSLRSLYSNLPRLDHGRRRSLSSRDLIGSDLLRWRSAASKCLRTTWTTNWSEMHRFRSNPRWSYSFLYTLTQLAADLAYRADVSRSSRLLANCETPRLATRLKSCARLPTRRAQDPHRTSLDETYASLALR